MQCSPNNVLGAVAEWGLHTHFLGWRRHLAWTDLSWLATLKDKIRQFAAAKSTYAWTCSLVSHSRITKPFIRPLRHSSKILSRVCLITQICSPRSGSLGSSNSKTSLTPSCRSSPSLSLSSKFFKPTCYLQLMRPFVKRPPLWFLNSVLGRPPPLQNQFVRVRSEVNLKWAAT